ncbi:uncharacterized protein [Dermacentor albipictus]|uniref:uncharacterized protein isoform X1 n=1 Tax=Dermacentor albipictus TaxID=60249 RepID=UPI0038FC4976
MSRPPDRRACEKASRETRKVNVFAKEGVQGGCESSRHDSEQIAFVQPLEAPRDSGGNSLENLNRSIAGFEEHCYEDLTSVDADDREQWAEVNLESGSSESDSEERTSVHDGLQDSLREWANEYGIKRRALTALLKTLRTQRGLHQLPEDGRTLMQTPRKNLDEFPICALAPGKYCHFGLAVGLQRSLSHVEKLPAVIPLSFNVDGLPLSKSSKMQLWPIQCLPRGCGNVPPFVVGAFAGQSKPSSSNDFLRPFVRELQTLLVQGVNINGDTVQVTVASVICDAPARAFVTMTKGHGGYSGCAKCTVEGSYINGKVVFCDMECPLRTDESFREQHDVEHHKGESGLLDLPIDIVNDLPLDYMHLALLGVMRKLLQLWISGPLRVRLGPLDRHTFNEKSKLLNPHIPSEFPRRPRGLDELDRWKAVEFRLFVFYTGPLLLKFCLLDDLYQHFLLLHASLSILANKELCREHAGYADELLRCFVSHFRELYGDEHVSFNVHSLIHLASDVKIHGELDSFSAFPFENNMQVLKRQLRKHGKPLEQLRNRMVESQSWTRRQTWDEIPVHFSRPHSRGELLPECCPPEYERLSWDAYTIALSKRDNCFAQDGHVVLAKNIAYIRGSKQPCIIGQEFLIKEDFYSLPFESSRMGIYVVSGLSGLKPWSLHNLQKMVKLPLNGKFLVIPELHTI